MRRRLRRPGLAAGASVALVPALPGGVESQTLLRELFHLLVEAGELGHCLGHRSQGVVLGRGL